MGGWERAAVYLAQMLATEKGRDRLMILIVVIIVIAVSVLTVASPLGALFARAEDDKTIQSIIGELQKELQRKINDEAKNKEGADRAEIVYMGSENGETIINSQDVLTIFAVRYGYGAAADQVFELTPELVEKLTAVFGDMNQVTTEVKKDEGTEDANREASDPTPQQDDADTQSTEVKTVKYIYVDAKSYEEMKAEYGFTAVQIEMADAMMDEGLSALFMETAGNKEFMNRPTAAEVRDKLASLPPDLSVQRRAVVEVALSLVGRVSYFWGGKSLVIGWDARWGELREVTAKGSKNTGKTMPYGMDCSGFTRWAFINSGVPKDVIDDIFGDYTGDQWLNSEPIRESEAQPGDIAFLGIPGNVKINHVGIVVGRDEDGKLQIVHCSSGNKGVVVTGTGKTFKYFRRPILYKE